MQSRPLEPWGIPFARSSWRVGLDGWYTGAEDRQGAMRPANDHDERAAAGAILRVVGVWLACGWLDLVGVALQALVIETTEPGDGGSGLVAWLILAHHGDVGGDTWTALFLGVAGVVTLAQGAALAWAVSTRAREVAPVLLIVLGASGLLARGIVWWAALSLTMRIAERGPEALAAYSIASSIAGTVGGFAWWAIGLLVLVLVALRYFRSSARAA